MTVRDREFAGQSVARRWSRLCRGRQVPVFAPPTRAFPRNPGMRRLASVNLPANPAAQPMQVLRGLAVSPGIAIGPVAVFDTHGLRLPPRSITPAAVPTELQRLDGGLDAAKHAASLDEAEARQGLGPQYADILAAHSRMIGDPTLRGATRKIIEQDHVCAEHAVLDVLEGHASRLERLAGSHLAARAADVRDIESRILSHLTGTLSTSFQDELAAPAVVLAHDLAPSEAARLDPQLVPGFATEAGGRASHTAIVATALEIPAVVGLGTFLHRARHCRMAIIDGDEGLVILDPDLATQERYRKTAAERSAWFQSLARQTDLPAETQDGTRIELWGNIEFGGEVEACLNRGALGVGLFRTEFLFLNTETPPSEDQQFEAYAAVVRSLRGRPITIRTLDLGADKLAAYRGPGHLEPNPVLGLRSLRLSLRDPELFRPQLRALLRASALGDVRILFPLVSTLAELRDARRVLEDVAVELTVEGYSIREKLPVGVMVEVPAAALIADHLAKEVDFFSIGTNDLIQYTLAVDRTNETVADLYCAADPAVLRLIAMVVEAARIHGIEVSVCGTMGGDPVYTMLLLGLGLTQLSMPPHQLPEIRRLIRGIRLETARGLAAEVLRLKTAQDVVKRLETALREVFPERNDWSSKPA
ncbi:MAG TPA: phosphoenolpyruvate--protein phosphotransferase [Isosphaeraceae bacterium]|nr:phosphoenolpyruvate--protein phosphotransferase [Isosphaeraceae bacterium]